MARITVQPVEIPLRDFAGLTPVEDQQWMQVAVARVEHVRAAQAVLVGELLDTHEDLGQRGVPRLLAPLAQAIELLMPHPNVTVFYGHVHQENHHMTGAIDFEAVPIVVNGVVYFGSADGFLYALE